MIMNELRRLLQTFSNREHSKELGKTKQLNLQFRLILETGRSRGNKVAHVTVFSAFVAQSSKRNHPGRRHRSAEAKSVHANFGEPPPIPHRAPEVEHMKEPR
jgi:hypothetical protein